MIIDLAQLKAVYHLLTVWHLSVHYPRPKLAIMFGVLLGAPTIVCDTVIGLNQGHEPIISFYIASHLALQSTGLAMTFTYLSSHVLAKCISKMLVCVGHYV